MKCENLPQCLTCRHCTIKRGDVLTYNEDGSHNFFMYIECDNTNVVEFKDDYGMSTRSFIYDTESNMVWVDAAGNVENCQHSFPARGYETLNVKSKRENVDFPEDAYTESVETCAVIDVPFSLPDINYSKHCDLKMGLVCQYGVLVKEDEVKQYSEKNWIVCRNRDISFPYNPEGLITMFGRPQTLSDSDLVTLLGKVIESWADHHGSYGMGGPGFLGLKFVDDPYVLVYCAWAASQYVTLDGRVLDCHPSHSEKYNPLPREQTTEILTGSVVEGVMCDDDKFTLIIKKDSTSHILIMYKNHPSLPPFGNGSERKDAFTEGKISDHIMFEHTSAQLLL